MKVLNVFLGLFNILLVLQLASCQCPTVKTVKSLNLDRYIGKWYLIERIPNPFDFGTCVTAEYSLNVDGSINITNSQTVNGNLQSSSAPGNVIAPGILGIRFPRLPGITPYNVLATNYEDYAVVSSCYNVNNQYFEAAWILSREKTLETKYLKKILRVLSKNGIEINNLEEILQNCNN